MSMFASPFLGYVKGLLLAAVVLIPFERFAGAQRGQRILRRGSATDAVTGLMNALLLFTVLLIVLTRLDALAEVTAPHLRLWVETRPLWAQAILAVGLGDLGTYGIHRLTHAVPWLWRFHSVHHSAEEMDWLVAVRNHPIDLLLLRVASIGPLIAVHVSPGVLQGFLVDDPTPLYPPEAKQNHIQGKVVLALTIDKAGTAKDIRVLTSPDQTLTDSAIAAVSRWRYRPYQLNGSPVDVQSTVEVNFKLP